MPNETPQASEATEAAVDTRGSVRGPRATQSATVDGAATRIGDILRNTENTEETPQVEREARARLQGGEEPQKKKTGKKARAPEPTETPSDHSESDADAEGLTEAGEGEPVEQEAVEQEAGESEEQTEPDADTIELDADALADSLGIPVTVNDDGDVVIRVKVDGEESDATLPEMVRRYQTDQSLSNRGKAQEIRERTHKERVGQYEQQASASHKVLAGLLQSLQTNMNPYNAVNWERLRAENPQQYILSQQDAQNWGNTLEQIAGQALQVHQQSTKVQGEEKHATKRLALEREGEKLTKMLPTFDQKTETDIRTYVAEHYSMDPSEVILPKAHLIDMAHDAMLFNQGKQRVAAKKQKAVPKFVKAGARRPKGEGRRNAQQSTRETLRKSGSLDAAADYFRTLNR